MASSLTILLMAIMANQASAFNLEPRIAIVKTGPKGSYFGYSVAQHQVWLSSHHHPPACFLVLHSSLFLSLSHSQPLFETSVFIFIRIPVLAKAALSASLPSVIGSWPYYPPCLGSDRRQKCAYFDQNNPNHATPDHTISNWPNDTKSNKTTHTQRWKWLQMIARLMSYAHR